MFGGSETTGIVKLNRFDILHEKQDLEHDVRSSSALSNTKFTPEDEGFIIENQRFVGFILEWLEGRPAKEADRIECKDLIEKLRFGDRVVFQDPQFHRA